MSKELKKNLVIIVFFIFFGGFLLLLYYNNNEENKIKKTEKDVNEINNGSLTNENINDIEGNETKETTTTVGDNSKEEVNKQKNSITNNESNTTATDSNNDQYIVATGYAGASNNAYYTKNGVLYHLTISTNKVEKIAEGVKKIEFDLDTILVYKGNDFKIFIEDSYLTFID